MDGIGMNYSIHTKTGERTFDHVYLYWTTTPPTQEGWYWAKRDENEAECVHVVSDYYGDGSDVLMVMETGMDYAQDLRVYSHWLGPLPVPEPPQEG